MNFLKKDIHSTGQPGFWADFSLFLQPRGKISWRQTAREYLSAYKIYDNNKAQRQIFDESLADWKFLLPVDQDSKVLCLGVCSGAKLISLSRTYSAVYAYSEAIATLRLIQRIKEQEGIRNIFFLHGSLERCLPLADSCVDFVDIDWNGLFKMQEEKKRQRLIFLNSLFSEISRVLKPQGKVYFTSCGSIFAKLRGYYKEHNLWGSLGFWLKKLNRSGFREFNSYLLYPHPYYFSILLPLSSGRGPDFYLKAVQVNFLGKGDIFKRFALEAACRFRALNYFLPGFGILAAKE